MDVADHAHPGSGDLHLAPQLLPATTDNSAGWQQTVMAFLAEKERRSGSKRTVEGYARMTATRPVAELAQKELRDVVLVLRLGRSAHDTSMEQGH